MANEYLTRRPTSVGNRRVFTWSTWIKRGKLGTNQNIFCSTEPALISKLLFDGNNKLVYQNNSPSFELTSTQSFRDVGSWMHILFVANTTASIESERIQIFVNGTRLTSFSSATYPAVNSQLIFNYGIGHWISSEASNVNYFEGEFADIFFIDGQALTPDVFGFNKPGKGYISSGSSVATDFRGGQWVPKTPRIIKSEINRRGGFGVNGFYLPMNDSNNFGADFHCTPNSIIKLQENLPQPRCRIDGVGDYTGSLRDDPFKQYLVLALPFVSGGLQNGFGDYSAAIRGSGTPKTITNSNTAISTFSSYYGSAGNFTSSSSSYMTTPRNVSDYNMGSGDYTVEGWFYFKSINTAQWTRFFSIGNGSAGNEEGILFEIEQSTSIITFYSRDTNGNNLINGPVMIAGQWYHMALCRRSNIVSAYVNGVCVGTADCGTRAVNFTSNTALIIGAWENQIGSYTRFADAYMQDLRVYKGVAKYTGGFDVPNHYTPVGISTWRAVPDTISNNFATPNPLVPPLTDTLTYTDGNNTITNTNTAGGITYATFSVDSGMWYYECRVAGISGGSHILGWMLSPYSTDDSVWVRSNGIKYSLATNQMSNAFPTWANGDFIMIAYDHSSRKLWAGKNGVWYSGQTTTYSQPSPSDSNWVAQMTTTTGSASPRLQYDNVSGTKEFIVNFGQNPTFSGQTTVGTFTDSNGKGQFRYQPPTGFLALCEDNLPKPTVEDPGKHFKTILYTGNGLNGRSISGVGFKPDLVWAKQRDEVRYNSIYDSVRGSNLLLRSDNTAGDVDAAGTGLNSFDSDGFSVGIDNGINKANQQYVAWCWKAGNSTQTNTNGTITSTVSVNQTAGFSIVSWTGNGVEGATIGHGLNKAPKFIVQKNRDGGEAAWRIWHSYVGENYGLTGNHFLSFDAQGLRYDSQRITGATATTFRTTGTASPYSNSSGTRFITYCWAEIEGFSKFGSYSANFSADGPFVYCGFRPAFLIIKRTDSAGSWVLKDSSRNSTNPVDLSILAQASDTEYSSNSPIDFLSNGFKLRSTSLNDSGATFIFAAFAESPINYSNSK